MNRYIEIERSLPVHNKGLTKKISMASAVKGSGNRPPTIKAVMKSRESNDE